MCIYIYIYIHTCTNCVCCNLANAITSCTLVMIHLLSLVYCMKFGSMISLTDLHYHLDWTGLYDLLSCLVLCKGNKNVSGIVVPCGTLDVYTCAIVVVAIEQMLWISFTLTIIHFLSYQMYMHVQLWFVHRLGGG